MASQPPPIGSWDELFSTQFYTWEKRGRGWPVWNYPVELEPFFYPFYFYQGNTQGIIDDGRRPTLGSRLAHWAFQKVGGQGRSSIGPPEIEPHQDMATIEPDACAPKSQ